MLEALLIIIMRDTSGICIPGASLGWAPLNEKNLSYFALAKITLEAIGCTNQQDITRRSSPSKFWLYMCDALFSRIPRQMALEGNKRTIKLETRLQQACLLRHQRGRWPLHVVEHNQHIKPCPDSVLFSCWVSLQNAMCVPCFA